MKTTKQDVISGVIPNHIKSRRKALGMLQSDLARELGVTHAAISYWEALERSPSDATKIRLCQILHCSITELFDWEA